MGLLSRLVWTKFSVRGVRLLFLSTRGKIILFGEGHYVDMLGGQHTVVNLVTWKGMLRTPVRALTFRSTKLLVD